MAVFRTPALVRQLLAQGYTLAEIERATVAPPTPEQDPERAPQDQHVPSRLAPHHAQPFYGEPFQYVVLSQMAGGQPPQRYHWRWAPFEDVTTSQHTNTAMDVDPGEDPVPMGRVAIVSHVQVSVGRADDPITNASNVLRQFRWSVLRNDQFVPGFCRVPPSTPGRIQYNPSTAGDVFWEPTMGDTRLRWPSYIRGLQGDVFEFQWLTTAGAAGIEWDILAVASGWLVDLPEGDGRLPFLMP